MRNARTMAVAAVTALALATAAQAQKPAQVVVPSWTAPAPSAETKAAMDKAAAGDVKPLVALAEGGHADAQFYAGLAYIYGRNGAVRDGKRGCAFEEKAAASRPDAMQLVGECHQLGIGSLPDPAKAKAAFQHAADRGFVRSKCALGAMLLAEPAEAPRGIALCQEGAQAGDVAAALTVGNAYRSGTGVKANPKEARRWYEMAAAKKQPEANRKLGEMYARGEGGKKDKKKAVELWKAAEAGGDPYASILVADQMFSDITGGKTPGPGKFAFRGDIPVGDIDVAMDWYKDAQKRDSRPETQSRAKMALYTLASFKTAAQGAAAGGVR